MSLRVVRPGLLSLLVDAGRPRTRALGVPVGGAADRAALAIGNALVGNPPDAAAVEVTLSGPTLVADHPTAAVVFGAPFSVAVNGVAVTPGTTFTLEPGDTVTIGPTHSGARGYLCVAGGFDGPVVLGSRSGLEPLKAGDALACGASRCEPRGLGFAAVPEPHPPGPPLPRGEGGDEPPAGAAPIPASAVSRKDQLRRHPLPPRGRGLGGGGDHADAPGRLAWQPHPPGPPLPGGEGGDGPPAGADFVSISTMSQESKQSGHPLPPRGRGLGGGVSVLRTLPGPQADWFTDDAFFRQVYTVTPASNRMGVRLAGSPLARRAGELVSEAVGPGAVQVANDGLPIVLGVDGQTIGGYPKVAHVIRADLDRLAQLRPGDRVRFALVTADEAEPAARKRAAVVRFWLTRLAAAERAPVLGT